MKKVISCSRRTDIPAFYFDWLARAVKNRRATVKAPYTGKEYVVSLAPEDVHTIVLWSKNFDNFLRRREVLKDYRLFFQFTINDCPLLEPNVQSLSRRIEQAKEIASAYGAERLHWRFDPIVFWENGRKNNLTSFERIACEMLRIGVTACHFSFATLYKKVLRRAEKAGLPFFDPPVPEKLAIAEKLSRIALSLGITMFACCNDEILPAPGVKKSSCVDGRLLWELSGEECSTERDRGQRKGCGCTESVDIGSYDLQPCRGGCIYCYARLSED
jgi:hypothetical protein